jgi:hypothetical protein
LGHFYKLDKNHLIASLVSFQQYNLAIYKIENKDLVMHYIIRAELFKNIFRWNYHRIIGGNRYIFLLRDKKIMIRIYSYIYLFEIIKE